MRLAQTVPLFFAAAIAAGCGAADPTVKQATGRPLEGDATLIAAAQKLSDAVGGCGKLGETPPQSKVVGLDKASIVMLACNQSSYAYTYRLFAVRAGQAPVLLSVPDYDATGWFASDQAAMAEIDAGAGVLTPSRRNSDKGECGSEGRYQWDGAHFTVQEMHYQDCAAKTKSGPPFPVIWPVQTGGELDPNGPTPAP